MDVFLTEYDNGEAYEDNFSYVTRAFSSHDKAVQYIESLGFVKRSSQKDVWEFDPRLRVCPAGKDSYYDCHEEKCPFFQQDPGESAGWCVHENVFFRADNDFYTIKKMAVDEEG